MNNRGFTLVELLATIILLILLIGVGVFSVANILDNSKKSLSDDQKRTLEKIAEVYNISEGINEGATCISISSLLEKGYIEGDTIKNPENNEKLTGSIKIEYKNNKYIYAYQDRTCCSLISDTDNSNSVTNGDKYECEVKPGLKYNFFVLSQNSDGTTNLIMERNICEDGTVATDKNKCLVAWISLVDYDNESDYGTYGNNKKGPITAMNYLYKATDNWSNIPNIDMNYIDEGNKEDAGYGIIKTEKDITTITKKDKITVTATYLNLKARLPKYEEVYGEGKCSVYDETANKYGSCPLYLTNYLNNSSYITEDGLQNIEGIFGYWTLSSSAQYINNALYVAYSGRVYRDYVINDEYRGVRPVINTKL